MTDRTRVKRRPAFDDESPLVLGIEASTSATGIALGTVEGRLLAASWCEGRQPASALLLAEIDRQLQTVGATHDRVAAVTVTHGPGGFTGLRVGMAVAKTISRAWGARLYGFSTLAAAAARWPVQGDVVAALLDARRSEVYAGVYRIGDAPLPEALRADSVEPVQSLIEAVLTSNWPVIYMTGSGARRYREEIDRALGDRARWIAPPLDDPSAETLVLAGAAALRAGDPGIDPLATAPVYLRPSDAEKRHGIFVDQPAPAPELT